MNELTEIQNKLQKLEDTMLQMPQVKIDTDHYITDHVYIRRIIIPKGVTVTGGIHLTNTIDIMVYGNLLVVTEEGRRHITEPGSVFLSKKGLKKVAYAYEDTMWLTVHGLETEKDKTIEQLESELFVNSYRDLLELKG